MANKHEFLDLFPSQLWKSSDRLHVKVESRCNCVLTTMYSIAVSEFRAIDIDGLESSFEADEKNARYVWNTFHAERW